MDSRRRFEENINKLSQIIPEIALRVQYHDPNDWEQCETRQGEPNLSKMIEGKAHYLHSNYSAEKEAQKWFQSLDLEHVKVLYVYGTGLGYYYDVVKPWLAESPGNYCVFLEDDMSVFYRLLETERGSQMIDDRQVQLHYFHDFEQGDGMFNWVTWYFVGLHPQVTSLQSYARNRLDVASQVERRILHDLVTKEANVAEYMRFGGSFFNNFYSNLLSLPKSYHGNHLFERFKKVPAIICGAGPSLNKNFQVLKGLEDRALILAGGSSLNALSREGFLPHFAGGIDPNLPQYERLMSNTAFEVPFFYRGRMHHKAFDTIHGPRLYVNGAGGYFVAEWFEEELGIIEEEIVDEGHNVINFLMDIARKLGCDPIILVGMDLAFTGMQSYASGVIQDAEVKEEDILNVRDMESGAFLREDIHGEPIYTLWKWVAESQWVSDFAERHKDEVRVINATEGGLGFEGIENMTLTDVAEKYLATEQDLATRVHVEIQNARIDGVSDERVLQLLHELRQGLNRCEELCEGFAEEIEKMETLVKKRKPLPPNLQTGKAALYDVELRENPIYRHVLSIFVSAKSKALQRRSHQLRHDWTLRSDIERKLEQLKINREKTDFISETARVNRKILDDVVHRHEELTGQDLSWFFEDSKKKEPV